MTDNILKLGDELDERLHKMNACIRRIEKRVITC